ncbi:stage II sporulation protein R [Anaerotignum neopropionicum]|uniref:Stage II sporulation protein R n=1 Tax=Anaerotignum neopropionicum TaxID=36847 RepID=A0A136WHK8_9FIRM|nr:stage II sporulation protein R [Anaerotignum neopropionicum]KXL54058.1 stage II sporulation protein R [Anaerotignum neopropionicum]
MGRIYEFMGSVKELWKKEKWYWCGAVVIGIAFSAAFGAQWTKGYSEMIQNGISAKVVRFHVLANSDSDEDQALKLKVRDKVLEDYGALLSDAQSKEETLAALDAVKEEICKSAQAEVLAQGYDYPVSVSLVREDFPFKRYDDYIFPAGVYDALRIEIGEAEGRNWWCVLYPQMCYVDASWGFSTQESYERLENTLTEEEFLIVTAMEQDKITPKVKFKIVEWWQEREVTKE